MSSRLLRHKPLFKSLGIEFDEEAFQNYDPSDPETQINFIVRKDDQDEADNANDENDDFDEEISPSFQKILEEININENENNNIKENEVINDILIKIEEKSQSNTNIDDLTTQELNHIQNVEDYNHYFVQKPEHDMNCEEVMVRKHLDAKQLIKLLNNDTKTKENSEIINFAPGQNKKPISSTSYEHYDECAFPTIYGGDVLTYDRDNISYTRRVKYELRHHDRRNCINKIVLFKSKQKIMKCLGNQIQTALRKCFGKKDITVGDVRSKENLEKLFISNAGYQFMTNIRTSPAYAEKCGKRALAMVRQLGLPTIFFTITANEHSSPELSIHLNVNECRNSMDPLNFKSSSKLSTIDALNMSKEEKTRLIRNDPVACASMYENRKKAFLKHTKSKHGPFGENFAIEYFARREYQMRGSPHDHGMFWLKDAPVPDFVYR